MTTPDDLLPVTVEALDALAVKLLHSYRKRDGLTCYNYDHNRQRDERYMREIFAELVAPFIAHSLPGDVGSRAVELLREYMDAEEIDDVDARASELGACRFSVRAFLAALTPSPCPGDGK